MADADAFAIRAQLAAYRLADTAVPSLRRFLRALALLSGLPTETDFHREIATGFSVLWRHNWIVRRSTPALSVFVRSHSMLGPEVALEHRHFLAVFQAHDMILLGGSPD